MYGAGGTSSDNQANSSFILDGSVPHLHQEPMAIGTSDVLLYISPLLEDTQHVLVIRNLVAGGGEVLPFVQQKPWALMYRLNIDLQLDYFEVTGSTVQGEQLTPTCKYFSPCLVSHESQRIIARLSSRSIHSRGEGLQPAVIAGLALAAVAVLLGFVVLFILWRREYLRERKEKSDHPTIRLRSQGDVQTGKRIIWRSPPQI